MHTPQFALLCPGTLLCWSLGGRSLGLILRPGLRLSLDLCVGMLLLDGFALHSGKFFAVDQKLLDEPALTGNRGVLLDHQHYHEGVGDNKQNHQDGKQ